MRRFPEDEEERGSCSRVRRLRGVGLNPANGSCTGRDARDPRATSGFSSEVRARRANQNAGARALLTTPGLDVVLISAVIPSPPPEPVE